MRWNSEGRRRGPGRPFLPEQSGNGNPNGRPAKGTSVAERIRSVAREDGGAVRRAPARNRARENVRNAATAMDMLLAGGYGKVRVGLEIRARVGAPNHE